MRFLKPLQVLHSYLPPTFTMWRKELKSSWINVWRKEKCLGGASQRWTKKSHGGAASQYQQKIWQHHCEVGFCNALNHECLKGAASVSQVPPEPLKQSANVAPVPLATCQGMLLQKDLRNASSFQQCIWVPSAKTKIPKLDIQGEKNKKKA